jgi:transcriptional regulator with XRE-family HTH domain
MRKVATFLSKETCMRLEHMLVRLLRALSGNTQGQAGKELGVDSSLIAQFERGRVVPSEEHLEMLAQGAGLTVEDAIAILNLFEVLREPRFRKTEALEVVVERVKEIAEALTRGAYQQLLGVRLPNGLPSLNERQRAQELFQELEGLSQTGRLAVVQEVDECHTWALLQTVCRAVDHEAARNMEKAAEWVEVAGEIAAHIEGPEEWRKRLRKYVARYAARVPGSLPS